MEEQRRRERTSSKLERLVSARQQAFITCDGAEIYFHTSARRLCSRVLPLRRQQRSNALK